MEPYRGPGLVLQQNVQIPPKARILCYDVGGVPAIAAVWIRSRTRGLCLSLC